MKLERLLALIIAIPVLALFVGVGTLAFQIGESWGESDTRALIAGGTATCSGGFIVLALVLGLIVGVPLALRAYSAGAYTNKRWDDWGGMPQPPRHERALPAPRQPAWLQGSPQILPQQTHGSWLSRGPHAYDLFEESGDDFIEGEWQNDDGPL